METIVKRVCYFRSDRKKVR